MTGIFTDLSKASREKGMRAVSLHAGGKIPFVPFTAQFADLRFARLQDLLKARNAEAVEDASSSAKAVGMVFAAALMRDARYATARRRWMQGLGFNTALRGLYEGGKTMIEAENK